MTVGGTFVHNQPLRPVSSAAELAAGLIIVDETWADL